MKKRAGSASWPGTEPRAPQRCRAGAAPLAADSQRATLTGIVVEAAAAAAGHDRDSPRPLRHSVSGSAPDFGSGSCPGSSPGAGTRSSAFPYISAFPAGNTRVHRPRHPGQLSPETGANYCGVSAGEMLATPRIWHSCGDSREFIFKLLHNLRSRRLRLRKRQGHHRPPTADLREHHDIDCGRPSSGQARSVR
jgi:hypothetical protein